MCELRLSTPHKHYPHLTLIESQTNSVIQNYQNMENIVKQFVVMQSNATQKGTFITKLVAEHKVDLGPLGMKTKKETYYISTEAQCATDTEIKLDMSLFNVVERPFKAEDSGEVVMLKWLHLA